MVGAPVLFLYPNPNSTYGGVPLWTIFEWRDDRGDALGSVGAVDRVSWGRMKAMFD
jgi:hypothetical protein